MNRTITAILFVITLFGGAAVVAKVGLAARGETDALRGLGSSSESVSARLAERRAAAQQLAAEGGEFLSYQLALSERSALPNRIDATISSHDLVLSESAPAKDAATLHSSFNGDATRALRLLHQLETNPGFASVRPRKITWLAQPDGRVAVTVASDLWPIPAPSK